MRKKARRRVRLGSDQPSMRFESLERRDLLAVFAVTSADDAGPGTLREAIDSANTTAGADMITFNIGGGGAQTISLLSELPSLTDEVIILLATNALTDLPDAESGFAYIYDTNGDGTISSGESALRTLANEMYSLINEQGDL
jgi:hypothetical protein